MAAVLVSLQSLVQDCGGAEGLSEDLEGRKHGSVSAATRVNRAELNAFTGPSCVLNWEHWEQKVGETTRLFSLKTRTAQ